jgi:hypothetical protein
MGLFKKKFKAPWSDTLDKLVTLQCRDWIQNNFEIAPSETDKLAKFESLLTKLVKDSMILAWDEAKESEKQVSNFFGSLYSPFVTFKTTKVKHFDDDDLEDDDEEEDF